MVQNKILNIKTPKIEIIRDKIETTWTLKIFNQKMLIFSPNRKTVITDLGTSLRSTVINNRSRIPF